MQLLKRLWYWLTGKEEPKEETFRDWVRRAMDNSGDTQVTVRKDRPHSGRIHVSHNPSGEIDVDIIEPATDFATSFAAAYATDDVGAGLVMGGSPLGAVLGQALRQDPAPEPTPVYDTPSYSPPSYESPSSCDIGSSYSSSDSSSSCDSGSSSFD